MNLLVKGRNILWLRGCQDGSRRGQAEQGGRRGCIGSDEMEYPQVNPWKPVGLDYSKLNFKLLGTKAQYRSVQKGHCPLVLKFCVCPECLFFSVIG